MGQTDATRQSDWILPMMVDANGNPNGVAIAVTAAVTGVDLTTVPGLPASFAGTPGATQDPNPLGHYLRVTAQGGDVFLVFGPNYASVTGANAPAPATTNAVSGTGVVTTGTKGICEQIPAGTYKDFKLPIGSLVHASASDAGGPLGSSSPCRFVGLICSSGTATARLYQSSV
jgi:hypothetical protein